MYNLYGFTGITKNFLFSYLSITVVNNSGNRH
jgi:hypothetical protein